MAEMVTAQDDGVYDVETTAPTVDAPPLDRTSFRHWCDTVLAPAVRAHEAGGNR